MPNWENIIEETRDCQRLDYVTRYTSIPAITRESVSTHSYWVTFYATMIHNEVAGSEVGTLAAITVNALIHDLVEMRSGDFVRTFKYKTKELKNAVDEAEELVKQEFDPKVRGLYETARILLTEGNKDYVKSVIKAADFLSLYHYMAREIYRSNYEIAPFFQRMIDDLREMGDNAKLVRCYTTPVDFKEFYKELATKATDLITIIPGRIWEHTKRKV